MSMKSHHGKDINKWVNDVLTKPLEFYNEIVKFFHEVDFMGPFYRWPKAKQREVEEKYYIHEKQALCYLRFAEDSLKKEKLVIYLLKIYQTLIFKYMGWYQKSTYNSLKYSSDEIRTSLEALFVSTVDKYVNMYSEVRIPFGSFVKKRVFIQFRGELQDVYRKTVLYEQWKDRLYEKSLPSKTYQEQIHEYEEIYEKMTLAKNFLLLQGEEQINDFNDDFMHNLLLVYYFFNKKPFTTLTKLGYNYKPTVTSIKEDLNHFRENC